MTQKNLTSILVPKPLHKRLKAVVKSKGAAIQAVVAMELERFVTKEESRGRGRAA